MLLWFHLVKFSKFERRDIGVRVCCAWLCIPIRHIYVVLCTVSYVERTGCQGKVFEEREIFVHDEKSTHDGNTSTGVKDVERVPYSTIRRVATKPLLFGVGFVEVYV